jgi:hypothetical protein
MTRLLLTHRIHLGLFALALAWGCDAPEKESTQKTEAAASAKPTPEKPEKAPAPAPEPEPEAPASLTLEETNVEGFGKVKLPKGAKEMTLNEKLAYYSWRGDKQSMTVKISKDGGRTSLADAKKWAGLDAGKADVKDAREVSPGVFEVELHRESDGTNFVVMFDAAGRMSCMGVGVEMDVLKEVCGSYPVG